MFKLLDECAALLRRGVEELDNYVTEGCRRFMELEDILDQISLPDISKRPLREGLHHAKQYLKSQYKVKLQ